MITSEALLELSEADVNLAQMRAMLRLLAKAQKSDEDRRAKTRSRVQKHREIKGGERYGNVTCNATETNTPSPFPSPLSFPLFSPPTTPPIIPQSNPPSQSPSRNPSGGAKKVAHRIPDEWHVGEAEFSEAIKIGLTREQIEFHGNDFKDYWASRGDAKAKKLDWLATWRNWCRDKVSKSKPRFQSQTAPKPLTPFQEHQKACRDAVARKIHGDAYVSEFASNDKSFDLDHGDWRTH